MAEGLRYAFVPSWLGADEYGRAWEMALVFGVLAGWLVASFVLALLVFRWNRERVR